MSLPVSYMVSITLSKVTRGLVVRRNAIRLALIAFTEAMALRSIQGTCTWPPTGSQVKPKLCSIAISAAIHTCTGVPPKISVKPAAAIEHATPTSPWQPTSAPEIDAFIL